MGGSLRRRARRACFVAAAGCLLLAIAVPPSSGQEVDEVPKPEVFDSVTTAIGASVQADRDALIPVPDLLKFIVLDGQGAYETDKSEARSSLFFPGNGGTGGPALVCGNFAEAVRPELKPLVDACLAYKYPLTVYADALKPDGTTTGAAALGSPTDPVSANAVGARAHAGPDSVTTDAELQDLRVIGLPAFGPVALPVPGFELDTTVFTVDGATSRTRQRIVRGSLVADSVVTVYGIKMIGGLIEIANLRSESHIVDDAAGKRSAAAELVVSGLTVGGLPAKLTADGLVVGSPSGSTGPIDQQQAAAFNELLRAFNVKVTVLEIDRSPDRDGGAVASVGGLLIEFSRDLQGVPILPGPVGDVDLNGVYRGTIQLGITGARGTAVNFEDEVFVPGDTGGVADDGADFGADDDGSFVDDGALPELPVEETPEVAAPTNPESQSGGQTIRTIRDLFGGRLGLLYLAMMFSVLALCIAPRLTVPARLPGARS